MSLQTWFKSRRAKPAAATSRTSATVGQTSATASQTAATANQAPAPPFIAPSKVSSLAPGALSYDDLVIKTEINQNIVAELGSKLQKLQHKYDTIVTERDALAVELETQSATIATLRNEHNGRGLNKKYLKQCIADQGSTIKSLRGELQAQTDQIERLQAQQTTEDAEKFGKLQQQVSQLLTQVRDLQLNEEATKPMLANKDEAIKNHLTQHTVRVAELTQKLGFAGEVATWANEDLRIANEKIADLDARLFELQEQHSSEQTASQDLEGKLTEARKEVEIERAAKQDHANKSSKIIAGFQTQMEQFTVGYEAKLQAIRTEYEARIETEREVSSTRFWVEYAKRKEVDKKHNATVQTQTNENVELRCKVEEIAKAAEKEAIQHDDQIAELKTSYRHLSLNFDNDVAKRAAELEYDNNATIEAKDNELAELRRKLQEVEIAAANGAANAADCISALEREKTALVRSSIDFQENINALESGEFLQQVEEEFIEKEAYIQSLELTIAQLTNLNARNRIESWVDHIDQRARIADDKSRSIPSSALFDGTDYAGNWPKSVSRGGSAVGEQSATGELHLSDIQDGSVAASLSSWGSFPPRGFPFSPGAAREFVIERGPEGLEDALPSLQQESAGGETPDGVDSESENMF